MYVCVLKAVEGLVSTLSDDILHKHCQNGNGFLVNNHGFAICMDECDRSYGRCAKESCSLFVIIKLLIQHKTHKLHEGYQGGCLLYPPQCTQQQTLLTPSLNYSCMSSPNRVHHPSLAHLSLVAHPPKVSVSSSCSLIDLTHHPNHPVIFI